VSVQSADSRIRGLRPPKPRVDPYRPHGTLLEKERRPGGRIEEALTVFLAGAECPFACSFCDLWQWTIEGPTPPGALSAQVEQALTENRGTKFDRVKLYNASNFFDPRAVPPADIDGIAALLDGVEAVTVESHAATIGKRATDFARAISGRLEVAIGLESIHPVAMTESNKRLDLARFDRAVSLLTAQEIDVRVFVLLGMPYVPSSESVEWTVRTVEHAASMGASVVSIIPVRRGNGELERLERFGCFTPPTLAQLEEALTATIAQPKTVVTVDLWDIARVNACEECREARVARLRSANLTGALEAAPSCAACGPQ
jgi:radical SAM enzyme (TIGR01210 family)